MIGNLHSARASPQLGNTGPARRMVRGRSAVYCPNGQGAGMLRRTLRLCAA
jgi:hypothetical protein